ncbi:kinase [Pedobacter sp. HDW13]|uniref:kinase n=1 Tax=Pedobacter sp. HDW13 TaxID=2714940 RepID=UPI001407A1E1|nr:kinase [Pedobacter sp. HDW13]QIL42389.1 kinase [Pedobacter sp. HDW13]
MANNLLYFPYINLPKNSWTMRALIYYDTVSSIVPDEYFYNPDLYDPFMKDLVQHNLVIPRNPVTSLDHPFSLVDPFIQYVTRPHYKIEEKQRRFLNLTETVAINKNKFPPANINGQKFDSGLLYQLEHLGLARKSVDNWYYVENTTAGYLMSYLSNILAKKLDLLPATDTALNVSTRFYQKELEAAEQQQRRNKALKGILPFPQELDLSKLARLKEKYQREIFLFRSVVEQIAMDPKYDSERLLQEKINELNAQKDELSARMNESRLGPIILGTAMGLAGAVIGYASTNTLGGAICGLPSFTNAIYSALKIEDPAKIYDPSGMKYLAIIENKGIRKYNSAGIPRLINN